MSRFLFVDPMCPRPYQARTLHDRALGGTEATVVRVAEGLAQRGHRVTVAQSGRYWPARSPGGVAYVGFDYDASWSHLPSADAVVVLRQHKILKRVRERFAGSRLALWVHCVPGSKRRGLAEHAARHDATVVCVSDAHREAVRERMAGAWARTARIHNPVDDALGPDGTPVERDKLVFFSSPHKGLDEVLAAFEHVRRVRPTARLTVADPGYWRGPSPALPPGVSRVGALPHGEVIRHVRSAFAVFYPQARFEETFGLVFAEANAVGTPVVAHPHPAACEVLGETLADGRQLIDARDPGAAARRLAEWWAEGRPAVAGSPRFETARVVADWERVMGARPATVPRRLALAA